MQQATAASLAFSIVGVLLVAIATFPALRRLRKRFSKSQSPDYRLLADRYEDNDGVASDESESSYSVQLQRVLLCVVVAVGILVSLITAVLATLRSQVQLPVEQWLNLIIWVISDEFLTGLS